MILSIYKNKKRFWYLPQGIDTLPHGCSLLTRQAETNYDVDLIGDMTLGWNTEFGVKISTRMVRLTYRRNYLFFHLKHFTFL